MSAFGSNFGAKEVSQYLIANVFRLIHLILIVFFCCSKFRQEYLGMQTKYAALESKSRVVVAQQNSAVSGATLALSDLSARLTDLVEQLIASYNISEQELEVNGN